jgi:hypothetical protein
MQRQMRLKNVSLFWLYSCERQPDLWNTKCDGPSRDRVFGRRLFDRARTMLLCCALSLFFSCSCFPCLKPRSDLFLVIQLQFRLRVRRWSCPRVVSSGSSDGDDGAGARSDHAGRSGGLAGPSGPRPQAAPLTRRRVQRGTQVLDRLRSTHVTMIGRHPTTVLRLMRDAIGAATGPIRLASLTVARGGCVRGRHGVP